MLSLISESSISLWCITGLNYEHTSKKKKSRLDDVRYPTSAWATFGWASYITVQQGSRLGSCPTFPSPNPHYNPPSGHWPFVKSCLVGGSYKYLGLNYSQMMSSCHVIIAIFTIEELHHNFVISVIVQIL